MAPESSDVGPDLRSPDFSAAMQMHPVPGTVMQESLVPAGGYIAVEMSAGKVLRIVDIEGQQVADLVAFNANDLTDALSVGNSSNLNKRFMLREGDRLYSIVCHPLMTIAGYSNTLSFSAGSMCSEEMNALLYGVSNTRNCRDNLALALAPWGIDRRSIPSAFCPFMHVKVGPLGEMEILEPTSRRGDHYDLRAEMDLIVAVSNCPQERNPCNAFRPTPLGVVVYEPGEDHTEG
jgi:hypothetical protein